jgi:hypothetical protein
MRVRVSSFRFQVRYTETLVRSAVRTFCGVILRRPLTWKLYLATALVAVALGLQLYTGHTTWVSGASGVALLLLLAFPFFVYWLPTAGVDPAALEFIRARVADCGSA